MFNIGWPDSHMLGVSHNWLYSLPSVGAVVVSEQLSCHSRCCECVLLQQSSASRQCPGSVLSCLRSVDWSSKVVTRMSQMNHQSLIGW